MKAIGIDAGGSKTRVIVCEGADLERGILNRFRAEILGPCNYGQAGIDGVRELIKTIKTRFQIDDPRKTLVVGGFAGARTSKSHSAIKKAFEDIGFKNYNIEITSDAMLLLMSIGNNGIILVAGTGSVCIGRCHALSDNKVMEARAGGYGFRSLSEPGGYQLGIRAIDAALRIEDGGKQEATVLYRKVKEYFGINNIQQLIPLLYSQSGEKVNVVEKVAGLSKIVLQSAYEGEKVSNALVGEAVDSLARYVQSVHKKLVTNKSVVGLHGGLFKDPHGDELIIKPLKKHPYLNGLNLEFETLGVRDSDKDPLIEAMRYILVNKEF